MSLWLSELCEAPKKKPEAARKRKGEIDRVFFAELRLGKKKKRSCDGEHTRSKKLLFWLVLSLSTSGLLASSSLRSLLSSSVGTCQRVHDGHGV